MFPTTRYAVNDKAAFITAFVLPATDLLGPALAHWKNGRVAAAARPHSSVLFFLISQIGVNIAANSVSAANDLNCLFPRYVNIRRRQNHSRVHRVVGAYALEHRAESAGIHQLHGRLCHTVSSG
ncbi:hypothetical protein POJ06DRAFT_277771 [Lipomyces tetrasporus]|uniref:Uncharacterized protein n=1 Tax=Lipomyces tetrasporus TaxID=54092 RepID=A0AAD7VR11_9ASCO|nr:uncharacterized protein POJ06DRAFT_277771 [Lipomyces tetrasporus]KAJ8097720.1 hypothetical protein POJ06DRAFT_277771 [Lipomyces tetrasporus]